MFEVPDAKRVRRQDLYDSASERDSTPDGEEDGEQARIRAELNARLSSLLSLDLQAGTPAEDGDAAQVDEQPPPYEAEFEFRLFSTSAPSQRVVLAAEEDQRHDGPAISTRPISFYLRGELSAGERAKYQFAAVTGNDVLAEAKKRAWGLEVPWRVTKIVMSSRKGKIGEVPVNSPESPRGRKRPGKKRRIALRIRDKARREVLAAAEKQKMTKEEHLREKKRRLNREKKLKRKQKEKEKKMAAKGEDRPQGEAASETDSE